MIHSAVCSRFDSVFVLFAPDVLSSPADHLWLFEYFMQQTFFCLHRFHKRLTCDLLLFSHKHQPVFLPLQQVSPTVTTKSTPSRSKGFVLFLVSFRSSPDSTSSHRGRQQTASVTTSTDTIMSEQVSASQPECVTQ